MRSGSSLLRARFVYVAAALATLVAGLGVHLGDALSLRVRDVTGDALWAMMVAWWVSALVPARSLTVRAVSALTISWIVELSQLYHAPWIDGLRRLRVVHLVLGSDFDARDLASYAAGVGAAVVMEVALRRLLGRQGWSAS
jgi:hypothetical protein